ncbi:MAG: hypothetical protein KGL39_37095 [Patescibacteria group bacterium]|nr:hypothetical protein [Patescibacteria group bacterium]
MKRQKRQYRQGDVLLHPATIPSSAQAVLNQKRVVLAEGEATGHAHTIDCSPKSMQVLMDGQEMYLRVVSPVVLQHQEHGLIEVEPGEYVVKRQTEVWLEEVRQVMD